MSGIATHTAYFEKALVMTKIHLFPCVVVHSGPIKSTWTRSFGASGDPSGCNGALRCDDGGVRNHWQVKQSRTARSTSAVMLGQK